MSRGMIVMSESYEEFSKVVQNLLTNVTVGGDINVETIQQITQQIVIELSDKQVSNQVAIIAATQFFDLFKHESGEVKKALLLQILKTYQYDKNLPIELREEANRLYAEFASLSSEQFQELFKPSKKFKNLKQKLGWFIIGTSTGLSASKIQAILEDISESSIHTANIYGDEHSLIEESLITVDSNLIEGESSQNSSSSSSNKSETSVENSSTAASHQSHPSNLTVRNLLGLDYHKNSETKLILLHVLDKNLELQDSELILDLPELEPDLIANLASLEGTEKLLGLEDTEKIIGDIDLPNIEDSLDLDSIDMGDMSEVFDNIGQIND
jgi:hypothetical protein